MTDTTVKYFASTMSGAPALSGTAGALIGVLDACLVNGFGSVTLDSLVVASNVATGTVSTGHNFSMVGNTGPVITIAGATPAGLNGEWRIASVPGASTFTFATTGISDQTATGTITAKRSPAGWVKAYSETNKAAYQSTAIGSTANLLRIDDTTTTYATGSGYVTMSDIDTGTGPFLYSLGKLTKSITANATSRIWMLFADQSCFYLSIRTTDNDSGSEHYLGYYFGDIVSWLSVDAYHCGFICNNEYGQGYHLSSINTVSGRIMARSYTQIGNSVGFYNSSSVMTANPLGANLGMVYPSPVNNELVSFPVYVIESSVIRGTMPGFWAPGHKLNASLVQGNIINNIPVNNILRDFMVVATNVNRINEGGRILLDITGPWR